MQSSPFGYGTKTILISCKRTNKMPLCLRVTTTFLGKKLVAKQHELWVNLVSLCMNRKMASDHQYGLPSGHFTPENVA